MHPFALGWPVVDMVCWSWYIGYPTRGFRGLALCSESGPRGHERMMLHVGCDPAAARKGVLIRLGFTLPTVALHIA
jgi:hypothetical protein